MLRRPGRAWLLFLGAPILHLLIALVRLLRPIQVTQETKARVTVFTAYMVGDLCMALPALRLLQSSLPAAMELQVLCRPDCAVLVRGWGFKALPCAHPWFAKNTWGAFFASFKSALALRGRIGVTALDTDADPRTGLLLRVMGAQKVVSYQRPQARFFTDSFVLPLGMQHQSEKNNAVAAGFLQWLQPALPSGKTASPENRSSKQPTDKKNPIVLIGAWTRKDTKNWPLPYWQEVLTRLREKKVPFALLDPPDGDAEWQAFAALWQATTPMVGLPLDQLWTYLESIDAVITLDNFLGHMAAEAGLPVLWINGSSQASLVAPRGSVAGQLTQVVQLEPMPCRPCQHRCTETRHAHCLTDLHVEVVWPQILAFLGASE